MTGANGGFTADGRIVIVGASLAGLRAAEALRREGFGGHLTLIGDEPYEPYDRPPLSKQVLTGWVPAAHTVLPRREKIDAEWRLGVAATGLDLRAKQVRLADGQTVPFDRLLIATGVRARPWPNQAEAALDGVFVVRTRDDAERLQQRLAAKPRRVLVIGGGFTGCEIASVCRELDLPVTLTERGPAPLGSALGGVVGRIMADVQREHGVDLHCGTTVQALEGDAGGRLQRARLSDGATLDVDVAVVALGAVRNTEWLRDSGLAADATGVACDAGCRAFDINAIVTDDVFVAGDVARFPHPLYDYELLALEHWGNAVQMAETAAHNMLCASHERRPHRDVPAFWSIQFGLNVKSVGVPPFADQVLFTQGSIEERRFVAAYGCRGRITAAVTVNQAKWLEYYERLIEAEAPFPPPPAGFDQPAGQQPVPAEFAHPMTSTHAPPAQPTGHAIDERHATPTAPRS
jgi:3-phenylpropionate/trans-cinnamate dioxygenase ferredoxin reductase subunit